MQPLLVQDRDGLRAIAPYQAGKSIREVQRELGLRKVIKLASNEGALGPSPKALAALRAGSHGIGFYPDTCAVSLRERLAAHHGVTKEEVIIGGGSTELIDLITRICVRPDENLVLPAASFIAYKLAGQAAGREVREVPLLNLGFDLQGLHRKMDSKTRLVFLANPNNPTGTYLRRRDLEEFLRTVPGDVIVVLDEAYFEYADAADYPCGIHYLNRANTLVLRTFSKCHGLAGLRIGYAVGDQTLIDLLSRARMPFSVSDLAQSAALAALEDQGHIRRVIELNRIERARVTRRLRALGVFVSESQANFVLAQVHANAKPIFEALLRLGVIVRTVEAYGLPCHLRVTIGTPKQNGRMIEAFSQVLGTRLLGATQ